MKSWFSYTYRPISTCKWNFFLVKISVKKIVVYYLQCWWKLWSYHYDQSYLALFWKGHMESPSYLQIRMWNWCRIFSIRWTKLFHEIWKLDLRWLYGNSLLCYWLKSSKKCHFVLVCRMTVSLKKAKINVFSLKKSSFKEASCEVKKNSIKHWLWLCLYYIYLLFFYFCPALSNWITAT